MRAVLASTMTCALFASFVAGEEFVSSSETSRVAFVPETAFGLWFLRTTTWEHHVLRVAINDLKRLVDEINARPAAAKAMALKDQHKFKTEMDAEALNAMFPHMAVKVA